MSFGRGDEPRGDVPPDGAGRPSEEVPQPERGPRGEGGRGSRSPLGVSFVALLVLLAVALLVGAVLLWRWYGDQTEGTSVFEDRVPAGSSKPSIRLSNEAGQIRVEGAEGLDAVEITARRHARGSNPSAAKDNAAGIDVNVSREGSTVEISSSGGRNTGVDYQLRVPIGSGVEVESAAGDVEISGVEGDVSAVSEAGDVTVRDTKASVTVEATSGDVVVEGARTDTGKAAITVGSGDLGLTDLTFGILDASVEAGDVQLSGRFSGGGQVSVQTGDIDVSVPPEDTRELDLEARVGEVLRDSEPAGEAEGGEG